MHINTKRSYRRRLYFYLKEKQHPVTQNNRMPSLIELIEAAEKLFDISVKEKGRRGRDERLAAIIPHLTEKCSVTKPNTKTRTYWKMIVDYLKGLDHGIFHNRSRPTHAELLTAAEDLFDITPSGSEYKRLHAIIDRLPESVVGEEGLPKTKKRNDFRTVNVISDEFLVTFEWRKLRYEVIKESNGRCQACGRSPREDGVKLNVDHIKPRRSHPELALDKNNLQILCNDCNHGKGSWDETDWRI